MSDAEVAEETVEETVVESKEEAPSADASREKYRLIAGEEVLEDGEARPSTLAFLGMYVLGALVFGVHMLFNSDLTTSDDASL